MSRTMNTRASSSSPRRMCSSRMPSIPGVSAPSATSTNPSRR